MKRVFKSIQQGLIATVILLVLSPNQGAQAQTLNLQNGRSDLLTQPVGTNTTSTVLTASGFGSGGSYSVSISSSGSNGTNGVTTSWGTGQNTNALTVTFSSSAFSTNVTPPPTVTYTITVTRNNRSANHVLTLYPSNFWIAISNGNGNTNNFAAALNIESGQKNSDTTRLFTLQGLASNQSYAALGRGPYPTVPTGNFYYIPAPASNNQGKFDLWGVNGDGSGTQVKVLSQFDGNGTSNSDMFYVQLCLDKDGNAWMIGTSHGNNNNTTTAISLIKVVTNYLNTIPSNDATIVDDNVTVSGGATSDFFNGDIAFDGVGNLYAVESNNGNTYVYIGQPNGTSTTLTKKWEILDANGNAFNGSVNGICFDQFGGMYFSTSDNTNETSNGIYYLDPQTVSNPPDGVNTIHAVQVTQIDNITDMGTNVWPIYTDLPVTFANISVANQDGDANVKWTVYDESQIDHYEVQMSLDGKNFTTVGQAKALNEPDLHNYSNLVALNGRTGAFYFRIKGVGFDHDYYSNIVFLDINGTGITKSMVYPNPTTGETYLSLTAVQDGQISWQIYSVSGRLIANLKSAINKGSNMINLSSVTRVLPQGNYILQVQNNGENLSLPFVKE